MPGSEISRMDNDRNLTNDESFRATQLIPTEGYKTAQLYLKLAESTNNEAALKILNDVVNKNRVHVDESLKLLLELAHEEDKVLTHRTEEVEKIIKETL
jgi:hypothetical protein